ncbi:MAG: DMT family transporter [Ruminococcus sp.]|nr:DMT family transporter [Ruminococcus sp.]
MNREKFFSNKIIASLLALLCVSLWGTAFPVIKKCYEIFALENQNYAGKVLFAGYRFFIAGLMVLAVASLMEKRFVVPKKREFVPISIMGIMQIFLQYLFSYIGLSNTTGTKTSIISSLGTFLGVALSPLFFKNDNLTPKKVFGCGVGLAGIVVVNLDGLFQNSFTFIGEGFIVISTFAATAGNLYSKKISQGKNPMTVSAYHLLIGGGGLIFVGFLFGGSLEFRGGINYILLIYLGVVSAISFTVWTALLKYNPPSGILIFNLLIPIFGTIWSGILLGEEILNVYNVVSVVLITLGIVFVNLRNNGEKNEN